MDLELPYGFVPRFYQLPSWNALWPTGSVTEGDPAADVTRAFLLHHRRAGKDLNMFNLLQVKMSQRVGLYAHIFPTLTEGRRVIWNGMDRDGRRFLDYMPSHEEWELGQRGGWIVRKRDDEMSIRVANGSLYTVLGADHPDGVRGNNFIGVILSEYAFFKGPEVWDIIRPMLAENGGWMVVVTTPNGRNHSHALHMTFERLQKRGDPIYFAEICTATQTGAVDPARIQEDRDSGMSEEKIASEYECSYDASVEGSFYGPQMKLLREEDRIGKVPHDPRYQVDTYWDLGVRDPSAVWWAQKIGREHRLIDFQWWTGMGMPEMIKIVRERSPFYVYGKHYGPADLAVREIGMDFAVSRVETARSLGLNFTVVPKRAVEDGINATRALLATTYIDEEKCQLGIDALNMYRKKKMEGIVGPNNEGLYTNEPEHNWASHPADALRTGAMGLAATMQMDDVPEDLAPKIAMV